MWGLPHALLFGVRSSQFVSILNCSNSNLCICPTSAPSIEYNFIYVGNIIVIILTGIFFIFIFYDLFKVTEFSFRGSSIQPLNSSIEPLISSNCFDKRKSSKREKYI
uniref:Uncharacterized protein n=1 Tax=Cacopsylla melanoneura TaxID=428564 RepID=A0A8D9ANR3_9HEMI